MNFALPLLPRLQKIKLVLLDVDGVLTDGGIIYQADGSEIKVFNVKDGLGLRMLMDCGIRVGIVTGRRCAALTHRLADLGIDLVFDGLTSKSKVLATVCANARMPAEAIAYMGDDLPDLVLLEQAGLAVATADAHAMVRDAAHFVTAAAGGKGAVRELCEALLHAQGLWETAVKCRR